MDIRTVLTLALVGLVLLAAAAQAFSAPMKQLLKAALNTILGLAALLVLNALYGGSANSRLFVNVREKMSLCYYASSMLDKLKGLMVVSSGVEFGDFDRAQEAILAQLDEIRQGKITDDELSAAVRFVVNSFRSRLDSQSQYFNDAMAAPFFAPAGGARQAVRQGHRSGDCRQPSHRRTAAAAAAFRDSHRSDMGIRTVRSQAARAPASASSSAVRGSGAAMMRVFSSSWAMSDMPLRTMSTPSRPAAKRRAQAAGVQSGWSRASSSAAPGAARFSNWPTGR